MEEEELYVDLDSKTRSGWSQKKRAIQTRKRGWISRLKADICDGRVSAIETTTKTCSKTGRQDGNTLLPPIRISLQKPSTPQLDSIQALHADEDASSQSILCMICFSFVSIGNERVVCRNCPVVVHSYCIKNPLDYASQDFKDRLKNAKSTEEIVPTSFDLSWACAFCIHDVKKKNHDALKKYHQAMLSHKFKLSLVKIQALFRMQPQRRWFIKIVKCAKILQRLYRNRHFRCAIVNDRLSERRAVRIRLHEVIVYFEDQSRKDGFDIDLDEKYFLKRDSNLFSTLNMTHQELSIDLDGIGPNEWDNFSQQTKKNLLNNMILCNNGGAPVTSTLCDVDKGPFPPRSFFLTVAVNRTDDDKQIYRVDVPMRPANEFVDGPNQLKDFSVVERVNEVFEGFPILYDDVAKIKLYPPFPYILFPACPGGVYITLILSRVTEWPRACYLCEGCFVAEHALVWRQVTCASLGMRPSASPSLPTSMRRLHIHVKKNYNFEEMKKVSERDKKSKRMKDALKRMRKLKRETSDLYDSDDESIFSSSSMKSLASSSSFKSLESKSSLKLPSIDLENAVSKKKLTGARILWTILPSPNANAIVGYVSFHSNSSLSSSYIKYWCVILDECLRIYKSKADTKHPREVIDLTLCRFSLSEKEMIRIYRVTDKQVWYCQGSSSQKRQDWITWIREACHAL